MQARIARAILALEDVPFPHGSKKLKSRDGWRIRVGDYRVLYFADTKAKQITVGVIGHHRDCVSRLKSAEFKNRGTADNSPARSVSRHRAWPGAGEGVAQPVTPLLDQPAFARAGMG